MVKKGNSGLSFLFDRPKFPLQVQFEEFGGTCFWNLSWDRNVFLFTSVENTYIVLVFWYN